MSGTRPTIRLFVRSLTPSGMPQRQESILEQLCRLDERDVIGDYSLTVWGERVATESLAAETDAGEDVLETVAAFEEWAEDSGVSVDRFFEEQSVGSALTGERYTATTLPVVAMAEYVDGELRAVTPHETAEGVVTVAERLDDLAAQIDGVDGRSVAPVA